MSYCSDQAHADDLTRNGDDVFGDQTVEIVVAAAKHGVELILFPENCLTGYLSCEGSAAKVAVREDGNDLRQLRARAKKQKIIITAGFIEQRGDVCYSSEAIVWPDGTQTMIREHSVDGRNQRRGLVVRHAANPDLHVEDTTMALCICSDRTERFFDAARGYSGNSFIIARDGEVLACLAGTGRYHEMKEGVVWGR